MSSTAAFAGFYSGRASRRAALPQAANAAGFLSPPDSTAQATPPPDPAPRTPDPARDFNQTDFFHYLKLVYGIDDIPAALHPALDAFKLDNDRPLPKTTDTDPTLYVLLGDIPVTITKHSVTTEATITPEIAYAMAAAAAANPAMNPVDVSGTDQDQALLFWAAQHFNLEVKAPPAITDEMAADLAKNAAQFEQEHALPEKAAESFGVQPAPAQPAAAPPAQEPPRTPHWTDHLRYGHP